VTPRRHGEAVLNRKCGSAGAQENFPVCEIRREGFSPSSGRMEEEDLTQRRKGAEGRGEEEFLLLSLRDLHGTPNSSVVNILLLINIFDYFSNCIGKAVGKLLFLGI